MSPPPWFHTLGRLLGAAFFLLIAAGTVWLWQLLPRGFPLAHLRFWSNEALPATAVGVALAGAYGSLTPRPTWRMSALLFVFGVAAGAALASLALFPQSVRPHAPTIALPFLPLTLAFALLVRRQRPRALPVLLALALGLAGGAVAARAQQAPDAGTHPANVALPQVAEGAPIPSVVHEGRLVFWPRQGVVEVAVERVRLWINPVLGFDRRSPDGFWAVAAPDSFQGDLLKGQVSAFDTPEGWRGESHGLTPSTVLVARPGEDTTVHLEATTTLPERVASHLNYFTQISIQGHKNLALEFSPAPGKAIDVLPFDYPEGRPARFAWLGEDGTFHVSEATSGEKGPFRDLAAGKLARTAPLAITLWDGGRRLARVVLDDWAAQADTRPSPTAGWGVAMNAIEFSRSGEEPTSDASLFLTLAATSVGRGFDTVGHAAGTYRNRIHVLPPE